MALTFDADSQRYITAGIDHCAGYLDDGTGLYKGYAWNGLTSFEKSNDGADANDMWADNIKYATLRGAEAYAGSISTYSIPEELLPILGIVNIAGSGEDAIYVHEQTHKTFRVAYRTKKFNANGFCGYKYHVVYGLTIAANSETAETIDDSPEGQEFSWDFDGVPTTCVVSGTTYRQCEFTFTVNTTDENEPFDTSTKAGMILAILYGGIAGVTSVDKPTSDSVTVGTLYKDDNDIVIVTEGGTAGESGTAKFQVVTQPCCPDATALFNVAVTTTTSQAQQ